MKEEGTATATRQWRALFAITMVASGIVITAKPAAAENPNWSYQGFVLSNPATRPSNPPDPSYAWDPRTRVTQTGVGAYTVRFPGQASAGGTVHVTSYGADANTCQVLNWGPDAAGVDQLVDVLCFNASGARANSRFAALYQRSGRYSTARLAYAWANSPTAAAYRPSPTYQHSGGRGSISIRRLRQGEWDVTIPGMASPGGHVQVTAYGATAARCKVASWVPSGTNEVVRVLCFAASGSSIDVPFTLSFADRVSLFARPGTEQVAAYAWAPLTGSLPPAYSWHYKARTSSITRDVLGGSRIHVPDAAYLPNHVQVTAYGYDSSYCKIGRWDPAVDRRVDIRAYCFNATGHPANTAYSVAYLGQVIPW